MSLHLKQDVRVFGLSSAIVLAIIVAEGVYRELGFDLVVTAGIDGKHVDGSYHYSGNAVDLRTNSLPMDKVPVALGMIQKRLTPDYFAQIEVDHIHVQFKPKFSYETAGGSNAVSA
jgi:hypothetical protein